MRLMTLQETADFLEAAHIDQTIDKGHSLIHIGTNAVGTPFVLVNDMFGQSTLAEGM